MTDGSAGRLLDTSVAVLLVAVGVMLGLVGAFLVPFRLPAGVEGLSVAIALLTNLAVGLVGGLGMRSRRAAALPGVGWFVAVAALNTFLPGGDVVMPGKLADDPGVADVTLPFLLAGVLGAAAALVVTGRYTRAPRTPTPSR